MLPMQCAHAILDAVHGKENVRSVIHCATRLRLELYDVQQIDRKRLEQIDGVKGISLVNNRLQIVIGTGIVLKVYDALVTLADLSTEDFASPSDRPSVLSKTPWYRRLMQMIGDIFIPLIPIIVATGLLMGILDGLPEIFPSIKESGSFTIIHLFSNATFMFFPILIGFSSAKVFGGTPYLGAIIGIIMVHPNLVDAWAAYTMETIPTASVWFGLYEIDLVGYQGPVIPVIIVA